MIRFVLLPLVTLLLSSGLDSGGWEVSRSASYEPLRKVSEQIFVPVGGLSRLEHYRKESKDLWLRHEVPAGGKVTLLVKDWPEGTSLFAGNERLSVLKVSDPGIFDLAKRDTPIYIYFRVSGDGKPVQVEPSLIAAEGPASMVLKMIPFLRMQTTRIGSGLVLLGILLMFMILGLAVKKEPRFLYLIPVLAFLLFRLAWEAYPLLSLHFPDRPAFLGLLSESPAFRPFLFALFLSLSLSLTAALSLKKVSGVLAVFLTAMIVTSLPAVLNIRTLSSSPLASSVPPLVSTLFDYLARYGFPGLLFPAALFLIVFPLAVKKLRGLVFGGLLMLLTGLLSAAVLWGFLPVLLKPVLTITGWINPFWYFQLFIYFLIPFCALIAVKKTIPNTDTASVNESELPFPVYDQEEALPAEDDEEILIPLDNRDDEIINEPEISVDLSPEPGLYLPEEPVITRSGLILTGETVLNIQKGLTGKQSLYDPLWEVARDYNLPDGILRSVYADVLRSGKGHLSALSLLEVPDSNNPAAALAVLVLKTGLLESLREDLPLQETARRLHRMLRDSFPGQEAAVTGHILRLTLVPRGGLVEGLSFSGRPVLYRNGQTGKVTVINMEGIPLGTEEFSGKPLQVWRMVMGNKDLLCLFSDKYTKQIEPGDQSGISRLVRFFKAGGAGPNGYAEETLNRMTRELSGLTDVDKAAEETACFVIRARV